MSKKKIKDMSIDEILVEDSKRNKTEVYDPERGEGCLGERNWQQTPVAGLTLANIPAEMMEDPLYKYARNETDWKRLRCHYDFEYWCYTCVKIKPKKDFEYKAFKLNKAQRIVLKELERQRKANEPIRLIILKARQWGCSTLIQNYMAWIQMCHRRNWHSLICSHNKDSAVNIRRMYTQLVADYPQQLWQSDPDEDGKLKFVPFEGSTNVREISPRGCRIAVSSSENQDAMRGYDFAMAHLSETAYWRDSDHHSPDDLIRSVCASVALMPYSLIVMESTANGIGNFFYEEYQRAKKGESTMTPLFVPWYECEHNELEIKMPLPDFVESLTEREREFWDLGCSLKQINWYRTAARQTKDIRLHQAENPTDDVEAFASTNSCVFATEDVDRLLEGCHEPARRCDVKLGRFRDTPDGAFEIWQEPEAEGDYVVAVDVGGRTSSADWSVIAVFRRGDSMNGGLHETVAQWRGHVDHDLLVEIARQIATYYNEGLLVVESNTLESDGGEAFLLQRLADSYGNIYRRRATDERGTACNRIGFHTNRSTKAVIIDGLIEAVRDGTFVERSTAACYELAVYEQQPNGVFAAKRGYHDDMVMTRAIGLYALYDTPARVEVPRMTMINRRGW